jgi:hypothetical protein
MKYFFPAFLLIVLAFVACQKQKPVSTTEAIDYTQFVDPLIGSDYHGHVFVGANVPFGAVLTRKAAGYRSGQVRGIAIA